jgi:hypothetical protein
MNAQARYLFPFLVFVQKLQGQALFRNNRDIGTTWTAVLKITQSTTRKTYRSQKINNDFRLKVEFNLKSRFPGIAARKR